jgi:hypothetical protein
MTIYLPIIKGIFVVSNSEDESDGSVELGPHELNAPDEGRVVIEMYVERTSSKVPTRHSVPWQAKTTNIVHRHEGLQCVKSLKGKVMESVIYKIHALFASL